ncbi:CoA-binding protein [Methylobacterium sp. Leaf125]|uniref:CoA-binding protein n=1 Tax=Methylobacterium sp. Leaf125 TaxID=1736265 RepID=UPI0006F1EFDE|nr:CoA-binding protein [Methylobacterium sp. Leaf125]KQQ40676.1 CoA-binding protein [Methylobacterium sp. Leaf125]
MRQSHDAYDPALIRRVLTETRTIALVGASPNPDRASHHVMAFLLARGYRVIPVNPGLAGQTLQGQPVYARLADLPEPVDMVEIFRSSDAAGGVVDEALALPQPPRFIWMQIGVRDDAAAERAEDQGCVVVMDRCPVIEISLKLSIRHVS